MNRSSRVLQFARISLVCIFLVILAGSVVRITGSGMGCPDWPTCFGLLVPPVSEDQVLFSAEKNYSEKQMVIYRDTLWVADQRVSAGPFTRSSWHKYPKHDYASFNPYHTWTEYVNRLLTAVLALPILVLLLLSVKHFRRTGEGWTLVLSAGTLVTIGFEAWLGKLVVDGNLSTGSVTLHMLGSLGLITLLVLIIERHKPPQQNVQLPRGLRLWTLLLFVLVLTQVLFGTQVREEVDSVASSGAMRSTWVMLLPGIFLFHRSYSIAVTLLAGLLYFNYRKTAGLGTRLRQVAALVSFEILAGIVLSYAGMPRWAQPIHLAAAILLFMFVLRALLWSYRPTAV